ncbi:glycoside hydrolase family 16 protein [Panaeolus papilionaceus]|nr:glycoside hydrolase family 16 protein [Panaeolus papilionaceus]
MVQQKILPTALFASLATLLIVPFTRAATYDLTKEYSGSTFFNDWTFYNNFDNLTNGDAIFVSASVAASQQLAFVDPNTNHAIIKVDNTTNVPFNIKRNTVRITTNDSFSVGSVWTADILHVPFGCSVWPAWWSQAPTWPAGGEIDTFEGVNLMTNNQMGLHTLPGCTQTGQVQSSPLINSSDCSFQDNMNQGCITTDPNPGSFGAGFAQAGGGVFVTEFATTGISIWFFSRNNVPSALSSNASSIDTSTFGPPVGNWPSTTCSSSEFFSPQQLIFDITLCGDFAGAPSIFPQTCSGQCYQDFVVGSGANYATAFFEIASVRIFSATGTNTIISPSPVAGSSGGAPAATSAGSLNSGSSGSGGSGGNSAIPKGQSGGAGHLATWSISSAVGLAVVAVLAGF